MHHAQLAAILSMFKWGLQCIESSSGFLLRQYTLRSVPCKQYED